MIGTRIGPYVVQAKLGEGGMGAVFVAEHAMLDTTRVIKLLLPELTRNATVVQRFINEARAAAAIQHRNIVAVHDVGQAASGDWYIVMDHVAGCTLRALLATAGGPLLPGDALHLLAQLANGLAAAHARGVIHRDLKPDNILVTQRDRNDRHVVILDFGVAKLSEQLAGSLTITGQAIGTPAYMSPEQLRGATVDTTCDVFALAVIAYQLVTGGALPFQDTDECLPAAELYHRQLNGAVVDPRQRVATVPDGWVRAILAALERDPALRPQTPAAFVRALAEATPAGTEILLACAPELLDATPRMSASAIVTVAARSPTTLGAAAGQSMTDAPRARPFWPMLVLASLVTSLATLAVMLRPGDRIPHVALAPAPVMSAVETGVPIERVVVREAAPPATIERAPEGVGRVVITVAPWALVTIDRRTYGQTPVTVALPAGRHRVRLAADARSETFDVTVVANKAVTIERSWK